MKKLCILTGYYPIKSGGAEYQAYLLAQELKQCFEIFFISIGHCKEEMFESEGFRIFTLKMPRFLDRFPLLFPLVFKIKGILQSERPDCVYQRMGNAATGFIAHYGKTQNCKVIWHIASQSDLGSCFPTLKELVSFYFVDKIFKCYGIRNLDNIIGQAEYQNRLLEEKYNKHCRLIVPNFHPIPDDPPLKLKPVKVLWIANLKRLKQPELFLKVAQSFQHRSDIEFIMVGRRGYPEVEKKIATYCKSNVNLKFLGELKLDEVNELLATGHVLVNTSTHEGFPNTFIQAWLRRVPVVSLNVDPDGVLSSHKIGFFSRTFEQMLCDIGKLIIDEKLREEMAGKARKYATKRHSIKNAREIIDLVNGLADPEHSNFSSTHAKNKA